MKGDDHMNKRRQLLKAGAVGGGSLLFGFSLFGCHRQGPGEAPSGDRKEPPSERPSARPRPP
jgi:isoquinoline 1-oxidoreductase beta subunit